MCAKWCVIVVRDGGWWNVVGRHNSIHEAAIEACNYQDVGNLVYLGQLPAAVQAGAVSSLKIIGVHKQVTGLFNQRFEITALKKGGVLNG
jgi:hypothetical protein